MASIQRLLQLPQVVSQPCPCYGIYGTNGEPGCIRYCSGSSIPSNGDDTLASWCKEILIAVNDGERSLSYEIVDSNIGFKSYVSTVRVVHDGQDGCVIEWSFTVDPVEGGCLMICEEISGGVAVHV